MTEFQEFSKLEQNEWSKRQSNIREIIAKLDFEMVLEVNAKVTMILIDYFADYPVVDELLTNKNYSVETLPFIIPITEDVLKEMDLM